MPRIISTIVREIPGLIDSIVEEIGENLPDIVRAGISIAASLLEGIWEGMFGSEGLFAQLYDLLSGEGGEARSGLHSFSSGSTHGRGAGLKPKRGAGFGGGGAASGGGGAGFGGGIPEIPKRGAGFGGGMSTEGHNGKTGGINITQNIYSQAMSAADIMEEALFRQREAILFGV